MPQLARIRLSLFSTLALAVPVAACGGVDGGEAGPDAAVVGVAPRIVATTPVDGATGVAADAAITIAFSEPMDAASVAAALDAAALGEVALTWNPAGDQLTITPAAPLAYATGAGLDPTAVTARAYAISLGTGATDRTGDGLAAAGALRFTTLKDLAWAIPFDDANSASVSPAVPTPGTSGPLGVGDDRNNQPHRALLTFDRDRMPSAAVAIASATLTAQQLDPVGSPWALGAALAIDHVAFTPPSASAFGSTSLAAMGEFGTRLNLAPSLDVTDALEADRAAGNRYTQFRLSYPTATDSDGATDQAQLDRASVGLAIHYLVP